MTPFKHNFLGQWEHRYCPKIKLKKKSLALCKVLTKEVPKKRCCHFKFWTRGGGLFVIVNSKAFMFVCLFVKQPPSLLEGEKKLGVHMCKYLLQHLICSILC